LIVFFRSQKLFGWGYSILWKHVFFIYSSHSILWRHIELLVFQTTLRHYVISLGLSLRICNLKSSIGCSSTLHRSLITEYL
jgi:hypothetical protein